MSAAATESVAAEPDEAEVAALQVVLDNSRRELEKVKEKPEAVAWLGPSLDSAEGTEKVYHMIQQVVESPSFLEKISPQACHCGEGCLQGHGCCLQGPGEAVPSTGEVLKSQWWEIDDDDEDDIGASVAEARQQQEEGVAAEEEEAVMVEPDRERTVASTELGGEDYVLIEHEDVVEALAVFVARYIMSLPQAADMEPKAVQRAVGNAFCELRMGHVRRLWSWGKNCYRAAALSYSVFSMYQNPWIVAAVLRAVYTSARVVTSLAGAVL